MNCKFDVGAERGVFLVSTFIESCILLSDSSLPGVHFKDHICLYKLQVIDILQAFDAMFVTLGIERLIG